MHEVELELNAHFLRGGVLCKVEIIYFPLQGQLAMSMKLNIQTRF